MFREECIRQPRLRSGQHGFSLLQVLISVLILSIGLLGLAGLQVVSLRANQNAHYATQANLLAYDMVDRMRANREAALSGHYNVAMNASVPTNNEQAGTDLTQWLELIRLLLPHGEDDEDTAIGGGAVHISDDRMATVTVEWFDPRLPGNEDDPARRITLVTHL